MPTPPSTWYSGPLSPQQLNSDLYSIDGTGYKATGLLFHSHRVVMHESLSQSRALTVSTVGTWSQITGTNTTAFNILDTGALFGQGCENPGGNALYRFIPNALATSGIAIQPGGVSPTGTGDIPQEPAFPVGAGGNYLAFHTVTGQTATTTPAAIGAGLFQDPGFGEVFVWQGAMQPHTAGTQGAAYFLDLINAGGGCYGSVASPVAQQQVATMLLPQGNGWVADWSVNISNTASSADANNFSLVLGTQTVATSTNSGAIGTYAQTPYTANTTVASGEFLSVTAGVTTPTSQATYTAEMYGPGLPTVGNTYTWQPAAWLADGSATTQQLPANGTDTAGFTPRHSWVWASVSYQGQMVTANADAYTPNGDLTGWATSDSGTLTAVTGTSLPGNPLQPQPWGVQLTPGGSVTSATVSSGSFPATAGTAYQVTSGLYITSAFTVATGVSWYNTAGTLLSATSGASVTAAADVWTPVTSWNTAPSSAATGIPFAKLSSGSNIPATLGTFIAGIAVPSATPPQPQQSWTGPLTSQLMNGPSGPAQALTFLNNPPAMRVAQGLVTSIAKNAATPVTFPTAAWVSPGIDTYNAYNTATGAYVAPVNGLYLAFACFPFTANTTGVRYTGFQVGTTAGTTTFQGPACSAVTAPGAPTSVNALRVFDLQANDTVTPIVFQSSGGSLALADGAPGYVSRFGTLYLAPYSTGGVNSATPPVTSFHWFAGIPPSLLADYMSQHLGNDLSFLVSRPYFTGYQATAQTGLVNGTWNTVTIDTPGGIVHGSVGDNYGGWNAGLNAYVAQQPGWYLVMSEVYAALPSAATGFIYAGIKCPSSGGISPTASPDQYQTMYFPQTVRPGTGRGGDRDLLPGRRRVGVADDQVRELGRELLDVRLVQSEHPFAVHLPVDRRVKPVGYWYVNRAAAQEVCGATRPPATSG